MKNYFLIWVGVIVWLFFACKPEEEKQTGKSPQETCEVYIKNNKKLQNQILEAERNADRLENTMYILSENYVVIDEKIRLIQKIRNKPGQEKLLKRTASEIIIFFKKSDALLDSVEKDIKSSGQPQSSLLPIIQTVRQYLTTQENLFIEVNGSIQSISKQINELKKEVYIHKNQTGKKDRRRRSESRWLTEGEDEMRPMKKIFYIIGSRDELSRAKVVEKKGGFLGMGSTLQLSDKLEDMFFQSADFMIMKEIALGNTQKVNIITTHPKNSYLLIDTPGERFLKITDPDRFWSASNYLVVEVD